MLRGPSKKFRHLEQKSISCLQKTTNSRCHQQLRSYNTDTLTRVPNTTLQQTSSLDITTVSNTRYNRTSWTTQHALSSDHLPIITTINIRHDYRLQQNRRTFTNYKKADWTQFTEDTQSAFTQTIIPTSIHTANIIFTNHHPDRRQTNTIYQRVRCITIAGCYPTTSYTKSHKETT